MTLDIECLQLLNLLRICFKSYYYTNYNQLWLQWLGFLSSDYELSLKILCFYHSTEMLLSNNFFPMFVAHYFRDY